MVVLHAIIRRVLIVAILFVLFGPIKFIVSYPARRKGELEADDLGMEMMARACYDVREVIMFWQVLESIDPTSTSMMAHNGPERSFGFFKYIIGVTYISVKLCLIPIQNS